MKVLEALNTHFSKVDFDTALYKKIVRNNIEFITKNEEHKYLFGSRLIGCFHIKYTMFDKNIFYENIFNMNYEEVEEVVSQISSIPTNFKIARDDINLICFYIAHKFLTNDKLPKAKQLEYATEILNYFSYRTLVLISSMYFIYPISEEKAVSLTERLSNRYLIKRVKNWNEYCEYRSKEYLNNKFLPLLKDFTNDKDLPNAINDLYNRTKDTLKNIYSEFITMMEKDELIKSKKSTGSDMTGKEIIIDKVDTPHNYFQRVEASLNDRSTFIREEYKNVTVDIVKSVSNSQLHEALELVCDSYFNDRDKHKEIRRITEEIFINSIEYLQSQEVYITNSNVVSVMNYLVGNLLQARGTELKINKLKEDIDKLLNSLYKKSKKNIAPRVLRNVRNALYVYILLLGLVA